MQLPQPSKTNGILQTKLNTNVQKLYQNNGYTYWVYP